MSKSGKNISSFQNVGYLYTLDFNSPPPPYLDFWLHPCDLMTQGFLIFLDLASKDEIFILLDLK